MTSDQDKRLENWCERDQRFFNNAEWLNHLHLCNEHPKPEDKAPQGWTTLIVPSSMSPEDQYNANGEYVALWEVEERLAALQRPGREAALEDRMIHWQDEAEKAHDEIQRLRANGAALVEALRFLMGFVPTWAKETEPGYGETFYGTLSYEGDLAIVKRVDEIKALISPPGLSEGG